MSPSKSLNGRETMRFLVTGGAGFLGSSLVESLVELGHDVVVLDNLWRGKKGNLHTVLDRISLIEADACLPSSYASISDPHSIDVVYHLAAINGTKWFHEKSRLVMDVNINSTLRSLEFAEDHACRYVFISSPEAYGESEKMPLGGDESAVFSASHHHQRHAYGASKYLGELAVHHAVRNGMDARIVRPFNGYGPRLLGNEYGQVVAMMINSALQDGVISVHGDGSQTRSLTYIDDIVQGMLASGLKNDVAGMCVNLGSEDEISMSELAKRIASLIEQETGQFVSVDFSEGYPGDSKRRLPNLFQAENTLQWKAETSLEDGLLQTLRSML